MEGHSDPNMKYKKKQKLTKLILFLFVLRNSQTAGEGKNDLILDEFLNI